MAKRMVAIAALCFVLFSICGCGDGDRGKGDATGGRNGEVTIRTEDADYELGQVEGYEDGFSRGYRDGKADVYVPEPDIDPAWSERYAAGYEEGYREGYDKGHDEARAGEREDSENALVKEAMLAFVEENSAPGLQFELESLVINGDEAAARVICTNEDLEPALVVMKKGPGGWYGVDFGTGIEAPSWYRAD